MTAEWKPSPKTDADAQCEFRYQPEGWSKPYRFVALRKEKPREEVEAEDAEQYQLFETGQYKYRVFVTYQQWQSLGGQVRKGEHGSPVVYWGTYEAKDTSEAPEESSNGPRLFCKGYTVFNLEQVDGVKLPKRFEPKLSANERIDRAESFFAGVGVQVRDGGNRAYYRPDTPEAVYMPGFDQFPNPVDYYSTLAHESTHWTSHESRCNRELGKRFGDAAYAMEELIAELGSAYTMASLELELTPRKDHAAYIDSWLKVLKGDKRAIFTAASQAQRAADYLARHSGQGSTEVAA